TDYRKQGARLNLDQPIGSRVSLAFNSNVVKTSTRRGYSNNDNISASPFIVIAATPSWFDMRPKNGVYPRNPFIGSGANIFQTRDLVNTPEDGLRFIGGATLDATAYSTEHQSLNLRVDGGYDRLNQTDNITARSDLFWESADGLPGTVTYQ